MKVSELEDAEKLKPERKKTHKRRKNSEKKKWNYD